MNDQKIQLSIKDQTTEFLLYTAPSGEVSNCISQSKKRTPNWGDAGKP